MRLQKIFIISALTVVILTTVAALFLKPQMHKSFQPEIIIFKKAVK